MRKGAILACVGLALLASGCNTLDGTYLRAGVGTEVVATDIVASTNIQEIYFGEVCRQAGLSVRQMPDGVLLCDESLMPPGAWNVFVQAGMNDIDRRCDAYLAWLDDRRRWREPALKQLHSTAAVTAAIMGLTGVGAVPIAIVGAAFGFAQETFVNLSGRLITEINHSTVQSLVLNRQNAYRAGISNRLIPNRPAALYALRSYLRICMPMTIETEINTTMTGVDANGIAPPPMITPATIATPLRARDPIVSTAGPRRRAAGSVGPSENQDERDLMKFQAFLCLPQTGSFEGVTRTGIKIYQRTQGSPNPSGELGRAELKQLIRDMPAIGATCDRAQHLNFYERSTFNSADSVKEFQRELNKSPVGGAVAETGVLDQATRQKIAAVRGGNIQESPELRGVDLNGQVTVGLRLALRGIR